MAEQKRNTRNSKSTKIQPVNDYGRIQQIGRAHV